jgi:hypothetical protein
MDMCEFGIHLTQSGENVKSTCLYSIRHIHFQDKSYRYEYEFESIVIRSYNKLKSLEVQKIWGEVLGF